MSDLAATIRAVRFTPVRLRQGYAQGDVDGFLDQLAAAAEAGRALKPLVDAARFTTTSMKEGYDMGEVDDFLDRAVAGSAADGAGTTTAPPTTTAPTAPATSVAGTAGVDGTDGEPQPTAVQEQRGLLSRLFKRS